MPFKNVPRHRRSYGERILRIFDKTPPSIVCPHFWEINWAYGCPLKCSYCYLQGTFRGNKKPRYRKIDWIFTALKNAFKDEELPPTVFNSGELADSLMNPSRMEKIVDKFEEQDIHKLLLLSKLDNIKFLLKKPRSQTIVSFSINAPKVANEWESPPAPPVERRIEAARRVSERGYETRIRIDPMAPVNEWENRYCNLIDLLFDSLEPERITLGSLRGLQKTIRFCNDDSWTKYLTESETGWGKKMGKASRLSMYSAVKNYLEDEYDYSRTALCKEVPEIWKRLGLDSGVYRGPSQENWEKCRCNCVW